MRFTTKACLVNPFLLACVTCNLPLQEQIIAMDIPEMLAMFAAPFAVAGLFIGCLTRLP